MAGLRNARAVSAGGVVHREHGRPDRGRRRAPSSAAALGAAQGDADSGETLTETAARETREETGLAVEVEAPISAITYFFVRGQTRFHKTVHFYLMRPVGGSTDDHDHEFDEVRWMQIEEATQLLTHATERSVPSVPRRSWPVPARRRAHDRRRCPASHAAPRPPCRLGGRMVPFAG